MFEKLLPPLSQQYDQHQLELVLQDMKADIYLLRQFLEPAIHNSQNVPEVILDDLE